MMLFEEKERLSLFKINKKILSSEQNTMGNTSTLGTSITLLCIIIPILFVILTPILWYFNGIYKSDVPQIYQSFSGSKGHFSWGPGFGLYACILGGIFIGFSVCFYKFGKKSIIPKDKTMQCKKNRNMYHFNWLMTIIIFILLLVPVLFIGTISENIQKYHLNSFLLFLIIPLSLIIFVYYKNLIMENRDVEISKIKFVKSESFKVTRDLVKGADQGSKQKYRNFIMDFRHLKKSQIFTIIGIFFIFLSLFATWQYIQYDENQYYFKTSPIAIRHKHVIGEIPGDHEIVKELNIFPALVSITILIFIIKKIKNSVYDKNSISIIKMVRFILFSIISLMIIVLVFGTPSNNEVTLIHKDYDILVFNLVIYLFSVLMMITFLLSLFFYDKFSYISNILKKNEITSRNIDINQLKLKEQKEESKKDIIFYFDINSQHIMDLRILGKSVTFLCIIIPIFFVILTPILWNSVGIYDENSPPINDNYSGSEGLYKWGAGFGLYFSIIGGILIGLSLYFQKNEVKKFSNIQKEVLNKLTIKEKRTYYFNWLITIVIFVLLMIPLILIGTIPQNYDDEYPNESKEWSDKDNDGIGDNADWFPSIKNQTTHKIAILMFLLIPISLNIFIYKKNQKWSKKPVLISNNK